MNVSPYHIQSVIRAYGQRIGKRNILRLDADDRKFSRDVVNISGEAKRKFITQKMAKDIIARVRGEELQDPRMEAYLAEKVSEELGGALEIGGDRSGEKGMKFRVIDPEGGEIIKELSSEDAEKLVMKIYSRIEKIVEQQG